MLRSLIVGAVVAGLGVVHAGSTLAPSAIDGATSSFAIVVDDATYAEAAGAIDAYRAAIERVDRLPTWLVVETFTEPFALRERLSSMHRGLDGKPPLEGVVFVGAVPVAMVRDAQHMTSAFKMDQVAFPKRRSSVPSDRIYEDFDLVFGAAEVDAEDANLHYVSLLPASTQHVVKEIYSARILPGLASEGRSAAIAKFLEKCVAAKSAPRKLDHLLSVAGHGYHSESLEAWRAQIDTLQQVFPALDRPGGRIDALNHDSGLRMKARVLHALALPDLDFALFHAHGDTDMQFLGGETHGGTLDSMVDELKLFLRSRARSASKKGDAALAEMKADLIARYGVSEAWFDGAADPAVVLADETADKERDLYVEDVRELPTHARMLVLDECFNGCFVASPYVGGAYLFGPGDVVAVVGNTVNVLQDLWAHEFVGQVGRGVSVGRWHRQRPQLESMLLGDPTFRFDAAPSSELATLTAPASAAADIVAAGQRALASKDPVDREVAIAALGARAGAIDDATLVALVARDDSHVARVAALKQLAARRTDALDEALVVASQDPCEFVRRFAVILVGERSRDDGAAIALAAWLDDPSERVAFNARDGLQNFRVEAIAAAIASRRTATPAGSAEQARLDEVEKSMERVTADLVADLVDATKTPKERKNAARRFRNTRARSAIGPLCGVLADAKESPDLRAIVAEALGWFSLSVDRAVIEDALSAQLGVADLPEPVKAEVVRSLARLATGPNHPLTP